MGHFEPGTDIIVKMTKCRPYVHTGFRVAKGSPDTPTVPADKLLLGLLLIWFRAVFSTDLFLTHLHLIMTETGIWDPLSSEACGRS